MNTVNTSVTADFLRQHVQPPLSRSLADEPGGDAVREPLLGCVEAWVADLTAGRDAQVLAPERLRIVLQTIWLLSVVRLLPSPDENGRFVDLAVRADITHTLDLAVAAAGALDRLRGTHVVDAFQLGRFRLVEVMADAAARRAGVRGTA